MTIAERFNFNHTNFHFGAIALMLLMAATRSSHIGTPFQLPDASLAVFFLAGLWFGGLRFFRGLARRSGADRLRRDSILRRQQLLRFAGLCFLDSGLCRGLVRRKMVRATRRSFGFDAAETVRYTARGDDDRIPDLGIQFLPAVGPT